MRSKLRSYGRCAVAMTALGMVNITARAADTVQDFSANFNTGSTPARLSLDRYGEGAVPEVRTPPVSDGWDGGYVRMTHAVNSQANVMTFNQAYSGDYDALEISFDFSINNAPSGADGFGIVYMNSAIFGANTISLAPGISEEANLAGSFGVGFDTYNNPLFNDTPSPEGSTPNSMSLHANGVTLTSVSLENEIIPLLETVDGLPIMMGHIRVVPVDGGSNITVSVSTDEPAQSITPFNNYFVAGLNPYDGRLGVGARTGGLNANQDFDNFKVTVTPVGGSPTVVLNETFETAVDPAVVNPPEVLGGTPWTAVQNASAPAARINPTPGGSPTDGFMRIAAQIPSQNNTIAFDKTADTVGESIKVDFDFRIFNENGLGGSADGMSILLADTSVHGDTGPLNGFSGVSEEPNLAGALGIAFDTYDNFPTGTPPSEEGRPTEGGRANHVSLHWNGAMVQLEALDIGEFDLTSISFDHASLLVDFVPGGGNVSLSFLDSSNGGAETVVFDDFFVAGLSFPNGARAAFAARTGGAYDHHDVDNLSIDWNYEAGVLGDTNGDGVVDLVDLNNVRNNFGGSGLGDTAPFDGVVDLEDLNAVRNNFGAGSANPVPEPTSLALLALGAGVAVAMRRRTSTSRGK